VSSFPETRHTLIRRLADGKSEADWSEFLSDYWRPVCRFAARWGRVNLDDAEDIAGVTFQALVEGSLLNRWISAPQSRLRTLLCRVVRNVIANRARVQSGRERIQQEQRQLLASLGTVGVEEDPADGSSLEDAFYAAWGAELLQTCLQSLQDEYLRTGRGDYFRVLYGKVCEELSNQQVADALGIKVTDVENYYRRAHQHLGERLKDVLSDHVRRYCNPQDVDDEIRTEWERLGQYLRSCGGLERSIRDSYDLSDDLAARESTSRTAILARLSKSQQLQRVDAKRG
jgi:RNA polymerase sigma factor (sigma-70 family)